MLRRSPVGATPPETRADADGPQEGARAFVEVAVPLPIPGALTYAVPAGREAPAAGTRVRVPVGRRKVTGIVVGQTGGPPAGVAARDLGDALDLEPILTPELLDLARFVARYYLAPVGEVLRAMVPSDLEPWGRQRVRVTSRGALALGRDDLERELLAWLRDDGPRRLAEIRDRLPRAPVADLVVRLQREGKLRLEGERQRAGARYRAAVELAAGPVADLLERCGRSTVGREVVELLAAWRRPAAIDEITASVGCTPAVVRRLVALGVLRRFTEIRRLSLAGHILGGATESPPIELRSDQGAAVEALASALEGGRYGAFLLHGMTGSGKTEVYLRAAERTLDLGRGVLLLVPEIGLVPALAQTLQVRFGEDLAVLHSGLSAAERRQEWERVRDGRARVVLGARSALFAPVVDLGLIVVDEEQDPAYKQDSTPRYNGRDLALVRAERAGATAVLVSATPSLESRFNAERGKLTPLTLRHRAGLGGLPTGILVDLRESGEARRPGEVPFSDRLREEIAATLAAGDQIVLLRNRRGYAPVLLCRACGEDHRCDECGLPRTYHRRADRLVCHYCGAAMPAPRRCAACGEEALDAMGAGTERVEERFADLFPDVPTAVLDRDTVRRPGGIAAVLERFAAGDVRVLIGTQMVSKGHHFPRVALAAVLSADSYLGFPDFRAVERTYTLLTQLAGRAGRGDQPGRFVVQTWHPDHYAIQAALAHDDAAFAAEELRFRQVFHYPPYTRMIHLLLRDADQARGRQAAGELARALERHPLARGVRVLGPAAAPLERLRGKWRFQILLRASSGRQLRALVEAVAPEPGGDLVVDVDPQDLL